MVLGGESARRSEPPTCRAPFVTLEFDPFGDVQACCANAMFPLGNVATSTIDEIWRGPRAELLRSALRAGDLTLGCTVCRHRQSNGGAELPFESYQDLPMPSEDPGWPHRLSFSLHNTCNLACIMCGADRSSKIRSQRSHLAPLPQAYDDSFFEQLVPFLERCDLVDFVGGEPFLIRAHHRIWDLLLERGLTPRCGVTTNGTVWNARVEQVLEAFSTDVRVSIDGMSRRTFEQIRVGASRDEVFANLERFLAVARERETHLAINWSFVQQNWFELGEMLLWAEERAIPVNVMTVIEPEFGVQRLPRAQLQVVVDAMRSQSETLEPQLEINRESWRRQVNMLEAEIDRRARSMPVEPCMEPPSRDHLSAVAAAIGALGSSDAFEGVEDARQEAMAWLARWVSGGSLGASAVAPSSIVTAPDGSVLEVDLRSVVPDLPPLDGGSLQPLLEALAGELGGEPWLVEAHRSGRHLHHTLFLGREVRDKRGVVVHLSSFRTQEGVETWLVRDDRFSRSTTGVPVSVGVARSLRERTP